MKKIYLVHCWGGNINDNWYPWIEYQLSFSKIKVKRLNMPNSNKPEISNWIKKLEDEIKELNEEVYFIGHSIGCQTILRYLETKKVKKIGGILFVTPWCELLNKAIETKEAHEIAKPWLETPIDFKKIKLFTSNIHCIFSTDDYFVPLSQKEFFEQKLNANCIIVENKGHISEEDNIKYLPEILLLAGKMLNLELIEIVNEQGDFTGIIIDKELAHDRNLLHNEVSVFIVNEKNEILLQRRAPTKRFKPNKWGLCSGHVDAYESLEDAAIREVKEEIGLNVKNNELQLFFEKEINKRESNSCIVSFYYVKTKNLKEQDFIIQKKELTEVKWVPIDLATTYLLHDESCEQIEKNLPVFDALKKVI